MKRPGMGDPARGMMIGAGAASAKGRRARRTESCMMMVLERRSSSKRMLLGSAGAGLSVAVLVA